MLESVETITSHILSLYGSKVLAYTRSEGSSQTLDIQLEKETDTAAVYIHTSEPGVSQRGGTNFEQMCVRARLMALIASASTSASWTCPSRTRRTVSRPVRITLPCRADIAPTGLPAMSRRRSRTVRRRPTVRADTHRAAMLLHLPLRIRQPHAGRGRVGHEGRFGSQVS